MNIPPSTVKKYYLLIESYSCYAFTRDERERVVFHDYDVHLLQLIQFKNIPQTILEKASKILLLRKKVYFLEGS